MTGGGGTGKVPSLPPPRPKSPPRYPDLYGKRRELARVQLLEREIGFLEDELKFVEGFQPASRSCKEVADFVVANSDPFIPTTKRAHKSCGFWKWLCGSWCFSCSWICCEGCCKGCPSNCCSSSSSCCCTPHLEFPKCCKSECSTCQCQCQCKCISCFQCSRPKCSSCRDCCRCCSSSCYSCADIQCCCKMPSCSLTCCIPKCPSCTNCHCKGCCCCISCYPKCLKINLCPSSCTKNCCCCCYRRCYICY